MVKPKLFLTLATLLLSYVGVCQHLKSNHDFFSVDSIARTVKYEKDIYRLTKELTDPYPEHLLKVRAIFIWITANIKYDYKFVNKGKEIKGPDCKPGMNCEQVFRDWETTYIKNVLKNKEGICDGYARLFKKMCEISGIKSEIVPGYTRTKPYQVGISGPVNHAWNVVWLDSAYFLLDATWAAGFCEEDEESGKIINFHQSYDDYYWLTPFHEFSRNHYPKEGKWVFEPNYTKEKFAANPYYAADVISDINLLSPASGIITAKKGDTLHFKFDFKDDIQILQINSNLFRSPTVWKWEQITKQKKVLKEDTLALKRQQYVQFRRSDDRYEFDYVVPDNSVYYLEILFNYRTAMRFKVKTTTQGM